MPAPVLVQFEKEIDREMAKEGNMDNDGNDNEYEDEEDMELIEYGPRAQIVTNDLRSLDEMVSSFLFLLRFYIFTSSFRKADPPVQPDILRQHPRAREPEIPLPRKTRRFCGWMISASRCFFFKNLRLEGKECRNRSVVTRWSRQHFPSSNESML